jgi:hypothetical protein
VTIALVDVSTNKLILYRNIKAISSKLGIVVEEGKQPKQGKFIDKASQLALSTQKNNRQSNPTNTNC